MSRSKVTKQTAFIVAGKLPTAMFRVAYDQFPTKMYLKEGPCKLGDRLAPDTMIEVKAGESAIEVFSPEALAYIREHYPEAREVTVRWFPNL